MPGDPISDETSDLPLNLSEPAKRAFAQAGITTLAQVAMLRKDEILKLHGVGAATIRILTPALQEKGLLFATSPRKPSSQP